MTCKCHDNRPSTYVRIKKKQTNRSLSKHTLQVELLLSLQCKDCGDVQQVAFIIIVFKIFAYLLNKRTQLEKENVILIG